MVQSWRGDEKEREGSGGGEKLQHEQKDDEMSHQEIPQ